MHWILRVDGVRLAPGEVTRCHPKDPRKYAIAVTRFRQVQMMGRTYLVTNSTRPAGLLIQTARVAFPIVPQDP